MKCKKRKRKGSSVTAGRKGGKQARTKRSPAEEGWWHDKEWARGEKDDDIIYRVTENNGLNWGGFDTWNPPEFTTLFYYKEVIHCFEDELKAFTDLHSDKQSCVLSLWLVLDGNTLEFHVDNVCSIALWRDCGGDSCGKHHLWQVWVPQHLCDARRNTQTYTHTHLKS